MRQDSMTDFFFKLRILRLMVTSSFSEWRTDVWKRELDAYYCCDGRECGCMGTTVRELWAHWDPPA